MPPDEVLAFRISRTLTSGARELRREIKEDVRDQNQKIERLAGDIGEVQGDVRHMSGKLSTLVGLVEKQLDVANEHSKMTLTTTLDVGKQHALVPVEDAKARRDNIAKVVALVTSAGFLLALIKLLVGCG